MRSVRFTLITGYRTDSDAYIVLSEKADNNRVSCSKLKALYTPAVCAYDTVLAWKISAQFAAQRCLLLWLL